MEIIVFGAGSLGSLVGGLLAREHSVTLIGRDPHVGAVARSGLRITGPIEATVTPDALTAIDGAPRSADLGVVTVKSFDTDVAAQALATRELGATLSLQNGMGNEERLASHLDCPVLAGTSTYGAVLEEPGIVDCRGIGELVLGPRDGGTSSVADRVGEAFRDADIRSTVATDMPYRLWEKLAVNTGINPLTALARVENGAVLDAPSRSVAEAAARETARTARTHDVDFSDDEAIDALRTVAAGTAENESSMRQDLESGRRTEIDAINGYVVDHAADRTPVNATLAGLIRSWEVGRGIR